MVRSYIMNAKIKMHHMSFSLNPQKFDTSDHRVLQYEYPQNAIQFYTKNDVNNAPIMSSKHLLRQSETFV